MKTFPVIGDKPEDPSSIPYELAELVYQAYSSQFSGQSLERIGQRGGFGASEMDLLLPSWRTILALGKIPKKGEQYGECNRTVCKQLGASWYNSSTQRFYCKSCAMKINEYNPGLCVRQDPTNFND